MYGAVQPKSNKPVHKDINGCLIVIIEFRLSKQLRAQNRKKFGSFSVEKCDLIN